ncbi:uncharacterized protein P884DRAFT_7525 [Thermothelomyces heterothallicus CBS 202.75]|uniref:uncharacterized protein n=1 Tax=Thermothelomyces heterothallicus CBS 202.75 TaxID=1149848 RepID=UPI003742B065
MHISPIDFYLRSRIGGRASLFSCFFSFYTFWDTNTFTASSVTSFFFFNLIMARSWAGTLIAFTAWNGLHTSGFGFGLRRERSNATQPRQRPRHRQLFSLYLALFLFFPLSSLFYPFSWLDP